MKLKNILIVYAPITSKECIITLKIVKKVLKDNNIRYSLINRDFLKRKYFLNKDLIIALGGDGTFLRASHFIGHQPILGVNADVKNKEGFFMGADKKNFEKKIKEVISGNVKIKNLPRLECRINNKKINDLAINEFYIGPRKAYVSAKYILKVGKHSETHKSSGVLVTTPYGSYSWAKSCCGKTLPKNAKKIQFLVRDPYEGTVFKDYKLNHGILNQNKNVIVKSKMLDGVIVADSVSKEYKFNNSDKAMIKVSKKYLKFIER